MLVGEGVVCDAIPICRSDPHNCQPVAEMGSSSIRVGEGVVCDAIPICRSDPHNCQPVAEMGSSSIRVGEGVVCDAIPICRSDPHNCQPVAEMGSSSIRVGEGVVCDAIPIFRSEFTADHLENNLLDSEKQLEALRQSCSIPRSVGIRLVRCEELPSEPPKGHVMFYTQTLVTMGVNLPLHPWLQRMLAFIGYAPGQLNPGFWDTLIGFYIIWMECGLGEPSFHQWRYCYKMRPVKACTGYAECACRSERERVVFNKRKSYCTWKKRWCFLYNDWEHAKGVTPERRVPTHFQTVGCNVSIFSLFAIVVIFSCF
ncbi:hypothetical protein C1H46_030737 [Malus baccata]|uniref:Uncharacterized protein n=1 Tax=Malus baccata TaxID=106549 RepID=A0A540LB65_MALBA|nr:hypothetical protein C1H46_030737 [Malus baccata]